MAKSKEKVRDEKELGLGKIIIIVVIVFTIIPITIMSILYFSSEDFKFSANEFLSTLPGGAGQYFEQFPTRVERENQKKEVAKYLIDMEVPSAADKLIIIQNSDLSLYSDIVSIMNSMDSRGTEMILERVRENSIKEDILVSTISQMKSDELNFLKTKAQFYEEQDIGESVKEITSVLKSDKVSYNEMSSIMTQMSDEGAAMILTEIELDIASRIISNPAFSTKRFNVEKLINNIRNKEKQLIGAAEIYNMEESETIHEDLGTENKYKINELSVIFRHMDIIKAAEVISKIEDKEFLYDLVEQIKNDEVLRKGEDLLTSELMYGASILKEYDKKVSDFVNIASKMENDQILEMIEGLYKNSGQPQIYNINEEDSITISDRDLAIKILGEIQPRLSGEILSNMEPSIASEISKKLSLPSFKE